jgi:hypothetical protein
MCSHAHMHVVGSSAAAVFSCSCERRKPAAERGGLGEARSTHARAHCSSGWTRSLRVSGGGGGVSGGGVFRGLSRNSSTGDGLGRRGGGCERMREHCASSTRTLHDSSGEYKRGRGYSRTIIAELFDGLMGLGIGCGRGACADVCTLWGHQQRRRRYSSAAEAEIFISSGGGDIPLLMRAQEASRRSGCGGGCRARTCARVHGCTSATIYIMYICTLLFTFTFILLFPPCIAHCLLLVACIPGWTRN